MEDGSTASRTKGRMGWSCLDGARAKNDGKKAFVVRGVDRESFEILTLAIGHWKKGKMTRLAMSPKALCDDDDDDDGRKKDEETILQCAINKDGDAIAVTNGHILVTYHRVSTRNGGRRGKREGLRFIR